MTTSEDFRDPEVLGRRPPMHAATQWYFDQIHRASVSDPEVLRLFLRAMHMLDGPERLLSPRTALRVLRARRTAPGASPIEPA